MVITVIHRLQKVLATCGFIAMRQKNSPVTSRDKCCEQRKWYLSYCTYLCPVINPLCFLSKCRNIEIGVSIA